MTINFGLTASDYAKHRAGFPDSLFERLQAMRFGLTGQALVDLGTGTGTVARGFAARGCRVIGLDPAAPLLEQARRLSLERDLTIEFREGRAENTGLPIESVEAVTAGQCWHWFNGPVAAREAARILKPGGKIAICHFDWIPLPGNVAEITEALIRKHNPIWILGGGMGMYPPWLEHLSSAGFQNLQTFSYDVWVPYTPEDWRGRIRASAGVGASLSPAGVAAFDTELAATLLQKFPEPILQIQHRVWAVVGDRP